MGADGLEVVGEHSRGERDKWETHGTVMRVESRERTLKVAMTQNSRYYTSTKLLSNRKNQG